MTVPIARWLPLGLATTIAALFIWARLVSDGIRDVGDGVQHYMIARYAWKHPELFLDQWGKPMFTLLATPFAQFGYAAMTVFNSLLAFAATLLALPILRRSGSGMAIAFPVVVMLAPQYTELVMDGMTEILFGTMALSAVCLMAGERYRAGAVVASLTPLCRPEYVVFLPAVAGWLLYKRRYREVPLCGVGIAAYTLVGFWFSGDPLCWWTGDPYGEEKNIYGHGEFWGFVTSAPRALGWTLVILFLAALTIWPIILRKDKEGREMHVLLFCLAALPTLGVMVAHAYSWWTGTHGSAGLTRVLVTTVPLASLFALFTIGRTIGMLPAARTAGVAVCTVAGLTSFLGSRAIGPLRQDPNEEQVILHEICDLMAEARAPGDRVFTTHPYIPFRLGLDGFDKEESRMLWGFEGLEDNVPSRPRDLIFWESGMGPTMCGVRLSRLLDDTAFTVLGLRLPQHGRTVSEGQAYELWAFQRLPSRRFVGVDTLGNRYGELASLYVRFDTTRCADDVLWCSEREFPWTLDHAPQPLPPVIYDLWSVEMDVDFPTGGNDITFVLKRTRGEELLRYDERRLHQGHNAFTFRVPEEQGEGDLTLYIYAPGGQAIVCKNMLVTRERVFQERR